MKTNQRTAVVNTLLSILSERDFEYELNGETPLKEVLTDADKAKAREIIFTAFRSGSVVYKDTFQAKVDDDAKLKSYVSGLINNWINKAKEFNCGQAHVIKNKGSRAGNQDPEVKNMRLLLSVTADPSAQAQIQEAIDSKLAELKVTKQPEIDMSQIPEHLRGLVKSPTKA